MDTVVHKIGRRKTSVARIYLKKGKGNFTVNTKDWKDYFPTSAHQVDWAASFAVMALTHAETTNKTHCAYI